jgi:plasmid stabilization system protein ParE
VIPYVFHPEARAEYATAAFRYESQRPGLGHAFADAVERALSLIREFPEVGTPSSGAARRVLVRRFPYVIVYRVEPELVQIVAIADARREPDYWRHRT